MEIFFFTCLWEQCVLQLPSALQSDLKFDQIFILILPFFFFFDHFCWLKNSSLYEFEQSLKKPIEAHWIAKKPTVYTITKF